MHPAAVSSALLCSVPVPAEHNNPESHHDMLLACDQDICFPQWQRILLDWDILNSSSIEHFGLEKDAGVLVLDASQQQPLCLNWAPWNYNLFKQKTCRSKQLETMSLLCRSRGFHGMGRHVGLL
jgi:hypothetical protein